MSETDIKKAVREIYSEAARYVSGGGSCCGGNAALAGTSFITSNLYGVSEKGVLPEAAVSMCCSRRAGSVPRARFTVST